MKEKLIVFDLDGTLVDSTRSLIESHEAAWASVGAKCPSKKDILDLTGLPLIDIMQKLGPNYDSVALAEAYSQALSRLLVMKDFSRV